MYAGGLNLIPAYRIEKYIRFRLWRSAKTNSANTANSANSAVAHPVGVCFAVRTEKVTSFVCVSVSATSVMVTSPAFTGSWT
jgi:hypothetical protein